MQEPKEEAQHFTGSKEESSAYRVSALYKCADRKEAVLHVEVPG